MENPSANLVFNCCPEAEMNRRLVAKKTLIITGRKRKVDVWGERFLEIIEIIARL